MHTVQSFIVQCACTCGSTECTIFHVWNKREEEEENKMVLVFAAAAAIGAAHTTTFHLAKLEKTKKNGKWKRKNIFHVRKLRSHRFNVPPWSPPLLLLLFARPQLSWTTKLHRKQLPNSHCVLCTAVVARRLRCASMYACVWCRCVWVIVCDRILSWTVYVLLLESYTHLFHYAFRRRCSALNETTTNNKRDEERRRWRNSRRMSMRS